MIIEFTKEEREMVFTICKKDLFIKRFVSAFAYFKKTSFPNSAFHIMPNELEVDNYLKELINEVVIQTNVEISEEYLLDDTFDLTTEIGRVIFLKEQFLRYILFILTSYYGNENPNFKTFFMEDINTEVEQITLHEDKDFLKNVYLNIISKKSLMKLMTISLFISSYLEEEDIFYVDYDQIVDVVPTLINLSYEKIQDNHEMVNNPNEENIKDFILNMVEEVKTANTMFCNNIIKFLIEFGRENMLYNKNDQN